MSRNRILSTLGACGVLALSLSSLAPTASAADETRVIDEQASTMRVGAIDVATAEAAGNTVTEEDGYQVLTDGSTGTEIARVPLPGTVTTREILPGECGTSYFWIYDDTGAGDGLLFETGFDVNGNAFDFDWDIDIYGPNGFGTSWGDNGPKIPSGDWTSGLRSDYTGATGWHEGSVRQNSRAYLIDGRICFSAQPSDTAYIQ